MVSPVFSAITLVLAFRIVKSEQERASPRAVVLRYTAMFMAFALCLVAANIYLQLTQKRAEAKCAAALMSLRATILDKNVYEFDAPNPDHSKLQKIITRLKEGSEKSLLDCGVVH